MEKQEKEKIIFLLKITIMKHEGKQMFKKEILLLFLFFILFAKKFSLWKNEKYENVEERTKLNFHEKKKKNIISSICEEFKRNSGVNRYKQ